MLRQPQGRCRWWQDFSADHRLSIPERRGHSTDCRILARRLPSDEGPLESSLYLPVKRFLEKLGFEVKGEVCGCDLVALDSGTPTAVVIGELKLSFTLDLVLQAVDRTAICDEIWLAVRASRRGRGREHDPRCASAPVIDPATPPSAPIHALAPGHFELG